MAINQIFATFERIAATSGRNDKIALVNQLLAADPSNRVLLGEIVKYTYNPLWMYRMTATVPAPYDPPAPLMTDDNSNNMWSYMKDHLDQIRKRELTGDAAKGAIGVIIQVLPEFYRPWFVRIVNRDLKIGLQSWDKWFPGMLPKMSPMLCDVWDGKMNGGRLMEPKLDGLRADGVVDENSNVTWLSRNGKELWNTDFIDAEIKALGIRNVVLDGEFFAGNFGESMSITKSQSPHKLAYKLRFHMFDLLTIDEWNAMKCDRSTTDRKCVLREMFPSEWVTSRSGQTSTRHIEVVPSVMVATEAQVEHLLGQFMAEGYEGAVLKNPDAPYIFDRSGHWVKIKPQQEADLEIYDVEEGEGRLRNCVGAIKVRGKLNYKGRIYEIDTRVGTGLSDAVRNRMWDLHNAGQLTGKTAEIKFQEPTVVNLSSISAADTPVSAAYALRFPVFLRLREDK